MYFATYPHCSTMNQGVVFFSPLLCEPTGESCLWSAEPSPGFFPLVSGVSLTGCVLPPLLSFASCDISNSFWMGQANVMQCQNRRNRKISHRPVGHQPSCFWMQCNTNGKLLIHKADCIISVSTPVMSVTGQQPVILQRICMPPPSRPKNWRCTCPANRFFMAAPKAQCMLPLPLPLRRH